MKKQKLVNSIKKLGIIVISMMTIMFLTAGITFKDIELKPGSGKIIDISKDIKNPHWISDEDTRLVDNEVPQIEPKTKEKEDETESSIVTVEEDKPIKVDINVKAKEIVLNDKNYELNQLKYYLLQNKDKLDQPVLLIDDYADKDSYISVKSLLDELEIVYRER